MIAYKLAVQSGWGPGTLSLVGLHRTGARKHSAPIPEMENLLNNKSHENVGP